MEADSDTGMLTREYRDVAGRLARSYLAVLDYDDREHESDPTPPGRDGDSGLTCAEIRDLAAAIRDLDAVSRGPLP